jgi:hypothetical protein
VAVPRSVASLPEQISLGVLARTVTRPQIDAVLAATGKVSQRQRQLPAHVVVYYVLALALFRSASCREVLRLLLDGLRWLVSPDGMLVIATQRALSQARARLGPEPLQRLFTEIARPLATADTRGAFWRGRRLVAVEAT